MEAAEAYASYAAKPSAHRLFQVFNLLSGRGDLWSLAEGAAAEDSSCHYLAAFEAAAAAGDREAFDLTRQLFRLMDGDKNARGALRFVLAARALLVHGQPSMADALIALDRADGEEAARLTLDLFLFRLRCRVQDAENERLFTTLLDEGSNRALKAQVATEYLRHLWRYQGPSGELLERFIGLARRLPRASRLFRECVALAFRIGDGAAVKALLVEKPGQVKNYTAVLPLAAHLRQHGIPGGLYEAREDILRLARLHDRFELHTAELALRLANHRRSLAIVGNSPCELGRGLGPAIDGHDDVVRFNFFSQETIFADDYGRKFTIHVRGPGDNPELHRRSLEADITLVSLMDFLSACRNWERFARLDEQGARLAAYPEGFHRPLQKELQAEASLGLAFCSWVKQLRGHLPRKSCFGFAFVDQIGPDPASAHYYERASPALTHRWRQELEIFERLTAG